MTDERGTDDRNWIAASTRPGERGLTLPLEQAHPQPPARDAGQRNRGGCFLARGQVLRWRPAAIAPA